MASVDPSFACNSTETSGHNSDNLLNHSSKFQVIWCTHIRDMKESANLRDIPLPAFTGIQGPHFSLGQFIGASPVKLFVGRRRCYVTRDVS
jgi:hypothetical protein